MTVRLVLSRLHGKYPRGLNSRLKHPQVNRYLQGIHQLRYQSTSNKPLSVDEVDDLLSTPTWSVSSLIEQQPDATPTETITRNQLHHLLRLSALPLPGTPEEESKMIETLQSQLHFVRAVKSVDTTGVRPLHAIRDETEEAMQALRFDVEDLKDEFEKEEVVGFARRIRRKHGTAVAQEEEIVDVLKLASNKIGRYVVVNTKKT